MFFKIPDTFTQVFHFVVLLQVGKVGHYCIGSFFYHNLHYLGFIVGLSFPLFDGNGTLWAMSQAGSQPVAH